MFYKPENPLIVQSNHTLLLEVKNPLYAEARNAISSFTQLEKSPEYIHTYSITPLSLWNAAAMGFTSKEVIEALEKYSKYPVPHNLIESITELISRFGKLTIENYGNELVLRCVDAEMLQSLIKHPSLQKIVTEMVDPFSVKFPAEERGHIKQILIGIGYPAFDKAGYIDGDPYPIELKKILPDGKEFIIR
ncbi:MAG: helicase-associated domain-containing protein, partial [Chitinispirillaceae bacterium]|nr:helicase-associated domain-containing protein [Chitinispirillaceae bacterium]